MEYDNDPPTDEDLNSVAHDVAYEHYMLGRCLEWRDERVAQAIRASDEGRDAIRMEPIRESNAFFEAAVVHARNLIDFFISTPHRNDVAASHFLPSWRPDAETVQWLLDAAEPLNKRIFHVTAYRQRVEKGTHDQDLYEARDKLDELWVEFLSQLTGARRALFERARI